jgi:hypothetical protein
MKRLAQITVVIATLFAVTPLAASAQATNSPAANIQADSIEMPYSMAPVYAPFDVASPAVGLGA